ncbi:dephospho-CoA kinase [Aquabacterium sp.]|uniref:dephospho-CoA kinase n=1 Tax=Aquabacterium sp. TaxID=1872578 RepID=UPI002C5609A0|nr:dephospho-CoA kinase [Aquabacterium sp.]HSW07044.1 dephospho-CoA kinase [Aquabacterium sp.]
MHSRPWRMGLTGGIGSGKSTVGGMLVALGATLVDTDAIAHSLTAPGGAAMPALRASFGDDVARADGALDRNQMRARVFADSTAKRRLEAILHPMIGSMAQQQAAQVQGPVVFDVPLLTESSHWRARCQRVLVVDCSEATQVERVVARSGWSEAQVRHVIAQQASRPARRAIADAVIHNEHLSVEQLREHVASLWQIWLTSPA